MPPERKVVKTELTAKDLYRYQMAHFLASDAPDCYEYLRNIIIVFRGYEEIRERMDEELGADKDAVLKAVMYDYVEYYKVMHELRGFVKVAKAVDGQKIAAMIEGRIRFWGLKIPLIHDSILRAYVALVKHTDLVNIRTPSDQILNANANKLSYRTPMRRMDEAMIE